MEYVVIFFGEINHSGDGEKYTELIRNPVFMDGQDSASGHWGGGLCCSLVVRGGHGQRTAWEIPV
jgi:hypothetical protein